MNIKKLYNSILLRVKEYRFRYFNDLAEFLKNSLSPLLGQDKLEFKGMHSILEGKRADLVWKDSSKDLFLIIRLNKIGNYERGYCEELRYAASYSAYIFLSSGFYSSVLNCSCEYTVEDHQGEILTNKFSFFHEENVRGKLVEAASEQLDDIVFYIRNLVKSSIVSSDFSRDIAYYTIEDE